jgi:hypothetical protein
LWGCAGRTVVAARAARPPLKRRNPRGYAGFGVSGRYWARTSDLRLVEEEIERARTAESAATLGRAVRVRGLLRRTEGLDDLAEAIDVLPPARTGSSTSARWSTLGGPAPVGASRCRTTRNARRARAWASKPRAAHKTGSLPAGDPCLPCRKRIRGIGARCDAPERRSNSEDQFRACPEPCPELRETEPISSEPASRSRAKSASSAPVPGACKAVYTGSIPVGATVWLSRAAAPVPSTRRDRRLRLVC